MSFTRRWAVAAVAVTGWMSILGSAQADWRSEVPVFRIGILGGELQESRLASHACLKERTERALGVPVKLFASRDYQGVNDGLLDGSLDAAGLGAAGYAGLFLQDSELLEPLVTIEQVDGLLGYYSVLFVRADSPYQSLDDLRGKSLAFTERLSTSGFLVPYHELRKQGYEPARFFGRLAFGGGHPQAVEAVLSGRYDAGVTWTSAIGDHANGYSRGNLRRMVERGTLDMSDLRILWKSELIPEGPYVVRKSLPAEAKDLYRQVLLELADGDRACFQGIVGGEAVGFQPITHEYYDTIIDIRRNGTNGSGG